MENEKSKVPNGSKNPTGAWAPIAVSYPIFKDVDPRTDLAGLKAAATVNIKYYKF